MLQLDTQHYQNLIKDAKILEQDERGAKVYETPNNKIIKLFRSRRKLSSATFYSYAKHFVRNARRLQLRDLDTIVIDNLYFVSDENCYLVQYSKLEGVTLREQLKQSQQPMALIQDLIPYLNHLHNKGVFFRSIHFGNILYQANHKFALIDIADMNIYPWSLTFWQRVRNFRHLSRYPEDQMYLQQFGFDHFLQQYFNLAGYKNWQIKCLINWTQSRTAFR